VANSFNNVQTKASWVAAKGLDLLVNDLHIAPYFGSEYSGDYAQKFAIGRTMTIPLSQRYRPRTDMTYVAASLDRPTTTLPIDQIRGQDIEWESIEAALDMERGEQRVEDIYLKPAIAYLRQSIDTYCAQFAAQHSNMVVGALGTNGSTYDATSAAAKQALEQMGGSPDMGDSAMCLPPAVIRAIKTAAIGYFNPQADITKQFRSGNIGVADGFDFYASNSLYQHTAGTWAGAVTTSSANQSGSTLNVTCTTGDTFLKGDKFTIAAVNQVNLMSRIITTSAAAGTEYFTVTSDATGAGSAAALSIYPPIYGPTSNYQNVDALPGNGAALTLWTGTTSPNGKTGKLGLAITPGAFYMASVKLEEPTAVEFCKQFQDPKTGIALRAIRQWDNIQSRMTTRLDATFGCGVGLAEQCSVVIASA
jgi:hypothetical protein